MVEERFVAISEYDGDYRICDSSNDNYVMNKEEILDCLNHQNGEIKYLLMVIAIFKYDYKMRFLNEK